MPAKAPIVVGLIPARYPSERFPGKPLALINGKPMLQWTYEACKRSEKLTTVAVCTDDARIAEACASFGAKCVLTSPDHSCGTDRCAEAARKLVDELGSVDVVVNIQGDEPLVEPEHIDACVDVLLDDDKAHVGTLVSRIESEEVARNPNRVKVVLGLDGRCMYFSRAMIPGSKKGDYAGDSWLHIGMYSFRYDFLQTFEKLDPTPLAVREEQELLKALENGFVAKAAKVTEACHGVDVPEDVAKIEAEMKKRGISA